MRVEFSRPHKIILFVLVVVVLVVVTVVFSMQKKLADEKIPAVAPVTTIQPEVVEAEVPVTVTPDPKRASEEAQKEASTLQEQINTGTITAEEALKQINAYNAAHAGPQGTSSEGNQ